MKLHQFISQLLILSFTFSEVIISTSVASEKKHSPLLTIDKAISTFQYTFDSTGNIELASLQMAEIIGQEDTLIKLEDLNQYVAMKTGLHSIQYREFVDAMEMAKLELSQNDNAESISDQELGQLMHLAMNSISAEGQRWSGSRGLSTKQMVGIYGIVAAVILGVIALVLSKGEERINSRYNRRIRRRENTYDNAVNNVYTRPEQIDIEKGRINQDITRLNNNIDDYQQQIAYWNGVATAAGNSGDAQTFQNANANITYYNNKITETRSTIDDLIEELRILDVERNQYLDPVFVNNLLAQLEIEYLRDINHLEQRRDERLSRVPANQRAARYLGIAAGVTVIPFSYLLIDGSRN